MGYITLLSDLGLHDASVAVAKGVLMPYANGLNIADITHDVSPFNIRQAAYLLGSAYKNFPAGTYHILLFDLFSEKNPSLILSAHEGHYFFSPDNGTVPLAIGTTPASWQCDGYKKGNTFSDWLNATGEIISSLEAQKNILSGLPPYQLKSVYHPPGHLPEANIVDCEVIHIDRYENVVVNITKQQFESLGKNRQFRLQFMQVEEINEISSNYTDARQGYKLCRFNSNDYLEICINHGRAASLFGLRLNSGNNNIKIVFE